MPSSRLRGFLASLVERISVLALGSLAAESEADAAINEAECLDRIEQAARRYEAEEKPHLAERLRCRAAALTAGDPGGQPAPTQLTEPAAKSPLAIPDESTAPKRQRRSRRHRSQQGDQA